MMWGSGADNHTLLSRRRNLGVMIVPCLLVALSLPAAASNFGARYADNKDHYYHYVSLESYTITAANWGRDRIDATDMNTYDDGACNAQTDVCIFDSDYSSEWWQTKYGRASCLVTAGSSKCDKWKIQFDTGNLANWNLTQLRRGGCHEWGHTVGLKHFDSVGTNEGSCMWQSIGAQYQSTQLGSHSLAHVNAHY